MCCWTTASCTAELEVNLKSNLKNFKKSLTVNHFKMELEERQNKYDKIVHSKLVKKESAYVLGVLS